MKCNERRRVPMGRGLQLAAFLAAGIVVVGSATAGGAALVSASSNESKIYACIKKNTQLVQIVEANTTCKREEVRVSWNEEGPRGEQGPAGAKGEQGATGKTGAQGPQGNTGEKGDTGAAGANGSKGDKGDTGNAGAQGLPGLAGKDGESAYQLWLQRPGNQGKSEEAFLASLKGDTGLKGDNGTAGKDGTDGKDGAAGKSAYEIWKSQPGNSNKTEAEFLASLKGEPGPPGSGGGSGPDPRFGTGTGTAQGGRGEQCTLGSVWLVAGNVASGVPASGQILQINQNTALFSLLGTKYGGNGQTTFALPGLQDAAPNGLTYVICTEGIYPSRD
jgi:Phage Tail Collar Domain/Collagen triple helix repeat (20 copies)